MGHGGSLLKLLLILIHYYLMFTKNEHKHLMNKGLLYSRLYNSRKKYIEHEILKDAIEAFRINVHLRIEIEEKSQL